MNSGILMAFLKGMETIRRFSRVARLHNVSFSEATFSCPILFSLVKLHRQSQTGAALGSSPTFRSFGKSAAIDGVERAYYVQRLELVAVPTNQAKEIVNVIIDISTCKPLVKDHQAVPVGSVAKRLNIDEKKRKIEESIRTIEKMSAEMVEFRKIMHKSDLNDRIETYYKTFGGNYKKKNVDECKPQDVTKIDNRRWNWNCRTIEKMSAEMVEFRKMMHKSDLNDRIGTYYKTFGGHYKKKTVDECKPEDVTK